MHGSHSLSLTIVLFASPPVVCPRAPTYTPTGTNSTTNALRCTHMLQRNKISQIVSNGPENEAKQIFLFILRQIDLNHAKGS